MHENFKLYIGRRSALGKVHGLLVCNQAIPPERQDFTVAAKYRDTERREVAEAGDLVALVVDANGAEWRAHGDVRLNQDGSLSLGPSAWVR
jgi:hypothetical protein